MPAKKMTSDQLIRNVSHESSQYNSEDAYKLPAKTRTYTNQFNSLYNTRVRKLKSRVLKMANQKWSNETINDEKVSYVNKILDVKNLTPTFIIGTVFIDMKYKPNILKDVSENLYGAPPIKDTSEMSKFDQLRVDSYSDPEHDQIMLEDESGRIVLGGELLDDIVLVTGAIVGVLGMEVESGIFTVVDIVYPEAAKQLKRPAPSDLAGTGNKILLLSGLNICQETDSSPLELLKEYIMGELADSEQDLELLKSISRIIIAGNSIKMSLTPLVDTSEKNKYREVNKSNYDPTALKELDDIIWDLLQTIPVTIMPGETDPSEISFPKQPLHRAFFPKSRNSSRFLSTTNPHWFKIDDTRILGTSGENINDLFKYMIPNIAIPLSDTPPSESPPKTDDIQPPLPRLRSKTRDEVAYESRLKLLESTIHWQNILPTAPDTLWCYPYETTDPFTLDETPHVYFVGCQPKFETSKMAIQRKDGEVVEVRIIAIPEFSNTGEVVLLDSDTLECTSLRISC
ncbi:hypothetical protein CANARDRAFT_5736 [[Candida] arabinofermentans NRRL YB-2248]|uniref:DNA-directed DNA polymerase n=1 Tax=[Candida] arabinofermentans NRRL YB-2248 TaxID=983967 RepID=A0A1E4T631_9ASCO|nr:hypothetical protein CANARDRAFT_5736 [[Candida] arabinofermentans NRRL YB-2248]